MVMFFGLINVFVIFEYLMDFFLKNLIWKKCFCYIDDVIVFGKDFEIIFENLRLVFV